MQKYNPVVHFEFPGEDMARIKKFYEDVFDWKTNQMGADMGNYVVVQTTETDENRMVKTPGTINGGFYQKTADSANQYPSVVISVENLEAMMEKVKAAGGTFHGEPQDIPGVGRFISVIDTEGNRVSMLQPRMK